MGNKKEDKNELKRIKKIMSRYKKPKFKIGEYVKYKDLSGEWNDGVIKAIRPNLNEYLVELDTNEIGGVYRVLTSWYHEDCIKSKIYIDLKHLTSTKDEDIKQETQDILDHSIITEWDYIGNLNPPKIDL